MATELQPSLKPLWELPQKRRFSCCECPRLNSAHVDKNTPEEYSKACVVASTGRLTTGRSLSLTRPYDNPPSLVTELLISQDFPQGHFYASAFRRRRHYVFGLSVRPSVRPKPEIPSFDLYIGPLVHPTNRYRFTACPSVRPSVRRGFRTFAGDCMEGLA